MKIRIHVQDGAKVYEFENGGPIVTLGRNPAGTMVFEEEAAESVVSWDHARIDLSTREATLTDLRSTNGTYRNGQPVNGTVPLWPKDVVRLGQTGPTLTVAVVDLTPAAEPAARFAPKAAMIPVEVPAGAGRAAKPQAARAVAAKAAPVMSETRGIALQAVQNLMAQQEELRVQQEAQARHRRALAGVALAALVLFLLLGGGLLLHYGKTRDLAADVRTTQEDVHSTQQQVSVLGDSMKKLAADSAEHFGKIEQEQAAQKEEMAKKEEIANKLIEREAAKLRGGIDQLKKDLGATLDDLNNRLTPKVEKRADAAAKVAPGAVAANQADPRIEPGMKMDVIMRDGRNYYTGVLLGINGTEVTMQTNANAGAKPSKFDVKNIQAFQTRDGVFAYDESTGRFESAITYYRLNKASKMFERSEDSQDAFLAEDAQIFGPVNAVKALLAHGNDGEWVLGLPIPRTRSPAALEAYQIKEIVTAKGVYTYDPSSGYYSYKDHLQLANEAKEKRAEMWKEIDKKDWGRRVESYKLGTERLRALSHYFWLRWW